MYKGGYPFGIEICKSVNKIKYPSIQNSFQKITSHWSKAVYKYPRFQTDTSVQNIRFDVNTVTCLYRFLLIPHRKLKLSTCHISGLGMVVSMRSTYRSFFKFHFYQHYLSVIPHNLPGHAFSCGLPRLFSTNKSSATRFFNGIVPISAFSRLHCADSRHHHK